MSAAGPDTALFAVLVLPSPSGKNLIFCLQSSAEVCQGVLTLSCRGTGSSEGVPPRWPLLSYPPPHPPALGLRGTGRLSVEPSGGSPGGCFSPRQPRALPLRRCQRGTRGRRTCPQCRGPPSGNVPSAFGSRGRARPVGTGAPVNLQVACVRHTSLRRRRIKGFPANPSALHLRSILISKLMQV